MLCSPQMFLPTHQHSASHIGLQQKAQRGVLTVLSSAAPEFVGRSLPQHSHSIHLSPGVLGSQRTAQKCVHSSPGQGLCDGTKPHI